MLPASYSLLDYILAEYDEPGDAAFILDVPGKMSCCFSAPLESLVVVALWELRRSKSVRSISQSAKKNWGLHWVFRATVRTIPSITKPPYFPSPFVFKKGFYGNLQLRRTFIFCLMASFTLVMHHHELWRGALLRSLRVLQSNQAAFASGPKKLCRNIAHCFK